MQMDDSEAIRVSKAAKRVSRPGTTGRTSISGIPIAWGNSLDSTGAGPLRGRGDVLRAARCDARESTVPSPMRAATFPHLLLKPVASSRAHPARRCPGHRFQLPMDLHLRYQQCSSSARQTLSLLLRHTISVRSDESPGGIRSIDGV